MSDCQHLIDHWRQFVDAAKVCKNQGLCAATRAWLNKEINHRIMLEGQLRDATARIHNQRQEINRLLARRSGPVT